MPLMKYIVHPVAVASVATALLIGPGSSPSASATSETNSTSAALSDAYSSPVAISTGHDDVNLDPTASFMQPTLAAFSPGSFSIYYSPNCQNAFRSYTTSGTLSEWWINDTFNSGAGRPGFGKKIAWEGASVFVWGASVNIKFQPNLEMKIERNFTSAGGQCFNFKDGVYEDGERNKNYRFTLTKL